MMEEYAIYLLPPLLRQPIRKGRTRNSTKEVADAFVQVLLVSLKLYIFIFTSTSRHIVQGSPWSLKVLKFSTLKFKDLKSA